MNDYRSQISVTLWVVLATLALSAVVRLPERILSVEVLGSPLSLAITVNILVGLGALVMVCAGLEAALRTHPQTELLNYSFQYWALPGATVLTAAFLLPKAPTDAWWAIGLVITGAILGATLIAEYFTVDPSGRRYSNARLVLNIIAYGLAALSFVLVYASRSRALISATLIGAIAGLLTIDLLRTDTRSLALVLLYSLISAVVMAQATWVLNYLPSTTPRAGLVLLIGFYLLVGLAHQQILGRLTRLQVVEYLILATLATGLVLWAPV